MLQLKEKDYQAGLKKKKVKLYHFEGKKTTKIFKSHIQYEHTKW